MVQVAFPFFFCCFVKYFFLSCRRREVKRKGIFSGILVFNCTTMGETGAREEKAMKEVHLRRKDNFFFVIFKYFIAAVFFFAQLSPIEDRLQSSQCISYREWKNRIDNTFFFWALEKVIINCNSFSNEGETRQEKWELIQ